MTPFKRCLLRLTKGLSRIHGNMMYVRFSYFISHFILGPDALTMIVEDFLMAFSQI